MRTPADHSEYSGCGWLASVWVLLLVASITSPASATPGCADGTREALVDEATYPAIAGCGGIWTGLVGSPSANSLCASGWHVCSPAADTTDAGLVKTITYEEATGFAGCFAFNAAHDFGLCEPCDPSIGDQDDLAGMGTGCEDLYGPTNTSCLGSGRVDAENGSNCAFIEGVTTGVVCCQGTAPVPAMAPTPLLVTTGLLLLTGLAVSRRRRPAALVRSVRSDRDE